jgi:hypothetical protein
MPNVIISRRGFLAGLGSLLAMPAVVRAESLMPIVPLRPTFRPTFWCMHGGGMNFLACRTNDLVGVDLASLGLPSPGWSPSGSSWVRLWSYGSHPLGSLPREAVLEGYRQMRDREAARIAAGLHYWPTS